MAEQSVKLGTVGGGLIPRWNIILDDKHSCVGGDDLTLCQGGGDPDFVQLVLLEHGPKFDQKP